MRYAVTWTKNFRYYNDVDEVIFEYAGSGDLNKIVNDTLKRSDQTAHILLNTAAMDVKEIEDYSDIIEKLLLIKQDFNLLVSVNFYNNNDRDFIKILKENDIPFMFHTFAKDFSTLAEMRDLGASEAYIVEDLCFALHKVKNTAKGMKIRTFPDIAQIPRGCRHQPNITSFWIRPEDTEVYEDFIDTFEIFNTTNTSVIYEIYKKQQWLGNLRELIMDLHQDLENTSIAPMFGQMRLRCEKKCLYGGCRVCFAIQDLAAQMTEANINVIKDAKPKPSIVTEEDIENFKAEGQTELIESTAE